MVEDASNMKSAVKSLRDFERLSFKARIALSFIEKWGMVAACPDGEDSSGRFKSRPLTPVEVVSRAVETTERAFEHFDEKGWIERPLKDLKEQEGAD